MPINYKHYPPDWLERRQRILLRAGHCCEFCSVANYTRRQDGVKVVLTLAHLDRDPENWKVADERLAMLCQRCHLNYDRPHNIAVMKYGRNYQKPPQLRLSLPFP